MRLTPFCLLASAAALAGCSSIRTEVGHPLPESSAPLIEGSTRVETVVQALGPPHTVSSLPNGFAFLYEYSLVREFQLGISLKALRLPYFKFIKGDSNVSEGALLLTFDNQGVLRAQDSEAWRHKLVGGAALQWITSVRGLTDTRAFRGTPDQLTWGSACLQPPPVTLNSAQDLRLGSNGLQQRMAPEFIGQSTLEMAKPNSAKTKRPPTRR